MVRRITQWFIEPLNNCTNETVARALIETDLSEDLEEVRDQENHLHKVYSVDYPIVFRLQQDATMDNRLRFTVFNRTNNHGPVRIPPAFSKKLPISAR